jgi:hypothetical protein
MSKVDILLPIGERAGVHQSRLSPRLDSLKGKRIAVLYNNWKAMEYITKEYCQRLVDDYGVEEATGVGTPSTLAMPEALIHDVKSRYDGAIVGLATWGSCTSWCIHDATVLEALGIPVVALVTHVFDKLSLVVAQSKGFEDLPRHILPHPLNPLPEQEVRRIASEHLAEVVGKLVRSA